MHFVCFPRSRTVAAETGESSDTPDCAVSTEETSSSLRISRQLEEVRQGIFRLLSESDGEQVELRPGYQADEDSGEDSAASRSCELPAAVPPAHVGMGCVTGEREDRDSGIERGVGGSSRESGSREAGVSWLARLGGRGRGRGAGNSHSSDSPASPSPHSPHSPPEGGFTEQRVRELWLRLAQADTERLRAVEEAVAAERKMAGERRVAEVEAGREAWLQLEREREQHQHQLRAHTESRAREADLVNKLQVGNTVKPLNSLLPPFLVQTLNCRVMRPPACQSGVSL